MPRAYLRLDPGYDEHKESYPDGPYAALIACFCQGELQPERGRFRNERYLRALLGSRGKHVPYLIAHGDLTILPDARLYIDGWDEWQEGDWKVTERVTRIRGRQKKKVTPDTVTPDTPDVTVDVTAGRIGVSGAVRSGAVSGDKATDRDREPNGFDVELWTKVQRLGEELTGRAHALANPYGGYGAQALSQADDCPWPAFEAAYRQVAAVYGRPTARQLVFDAETILRPTGRAVASGKQAEPDPDYVRDQLKLQREARRASNA